MGSASWEPSGPSLAWRESRLDMDGAVRLHLPVLHCRSARDGALAICLGRRGWHGGGTALAVPFRHPLDVETEAHALWAAVRGAGRSVGAAWGTVGALCPPGGPWRDRWREIVLSGRVVLPARRDLTPLDEHGLLDIDWPGAIGGREAAFDAILAVVTVPAAIPTDAEVAAALLDDERARAAFHRNRLCGITTPRSSGRCAISWRRTPARSTNQRGEHHARPR